MKKLLTMIMLGGMALFAGCSNAPVDQTNTSPDTTTPRVVKIGVIAPLSGPGSSYGEDMVNIYKDAIDKFNSKETKVNVEFVVEDSKCNGKDAASATQKLVNIDQVDLVIGGGCSSEIIAASKITQNKKILLLSPLASSPEISNLGEYVYRFWNDSFSAVTLSKYLIEKGLNDVILLTEKTDYALSLKKKFLESFSGNIILQEDYSSDEKNFEIISKKIIQNSKEKSVIVLFAQSEATQIPIIKSFDKNNILQDYSGKIFGAYFFSNQNFLNGVGDKANGLKQVSLGLNNVPEKGKKYLEHFKSKYKIGSDDLFVLLDKESIDIILQGISLGNYDSESIKSYLDSITETNKREGYFSSYYFDNNGDSVGMEAIIQQIQSGQVVPVE